MVKQNEKVVKDVVVTQGSSPAEMIRMAVSGGADLEKLKGLLELQERWDANQSKKVFTKAFSWAQNNVETVVKTKINPQTHSKYAPLESIIESVKPIYTSAGFSVIFYEADSPVVEHVRICADVLHEAGHKETYHYDVPLDGVGIKGNANMTKIHGKASAVSYARRYLMCMIWNIPTGDDNDGNTKQAEPDEVITDKQLSILRDLLIAKGIEAKEGKMCGILKVESLENLPSKDYQKAVDLISAAKGVK